MSKKRLCLVIPSLQAGGMERVMSELTWHFSSKSYIEVHLILYGITREVFYSIPENIKVHIPFFRFNNRWRFISTIRTLFYLRKTIKRIDPSSILSFGEYWNNFVLLSILGLNYPVFISDRSQPNKSLGRFQDKLRKWLYPFARGLILQTKKAREIYLSKKMHNNIVVIGNPVRSISNDKISINREKIVLMVGRLIKSKHQDQLIEMFAKVSPSDWKLMIVGYDHLKQQNLERLKEMANDLNIAERVVFTGKRGNIDEIYLKSSIFAFTSSSEGFPNVIGEAMSAGLAVIAYDCVAGPSEMINDGENGYLIPLFNKAAFESKLSKLINDKDLRDKMGSNAKISIKEFSVDKACEHFFQFITN